MGSSKDEFVHRPTMKRRVQWNKYKAQVCKQINTRCSYKTWT